MSKTSLLGWHYSLLHRVQVGDDDALYKFTSTSSLILSDIDIPFTASVLTRQVHLATYMSVRLCFGWLFGEQFTCPSHQSSLWSHSWV